MNSMHVSWRRSGSFSLTMVGGTEEAKNKATDEHCSLCIYVKYRKTSNDFIVLHSDINLHHSEAFTVFIFDLLLQYMKGPKRNRADTEE